MHLVYYISKTTPKYPMKYHAYSYTSWLLSISITSFKWKKMNVYIGISVFCVSSIKSCIFIILKGPYLPQIVCEHNISEEEGNPVQGPIQTHK